MTFVVLASMATGVAARGQSGQPVQDGRALDANPQVGSGGYNLVRPNYYEPDAANRLITGNVTGLGRFHGFAPVTDPTLFRSGLGSSGLSFFQRRAVGVEDVLRGQTAAGLPYYGRSETIVNTGGILSGRNSPGSSLPRSTREIPRDSLARPVESVLVPGQPSVLQPNGEALWADAIVPRPSAPQARPSFAAVPWYDSSSEYAPAMSSPLFGIDPTGRRTSDAETGMSRLPETINQAGLQTVPNNTQQPAGGAFVPRTGTPNNLGRDAYTDLYNAVQYAQAYRKSYLTEQVRDRLSHERGPSVAASLKQVRTRAGAGQTPDLPTADAERLEQMERFETAARWAKTILDRPITTFAAREKNDLNTYLAAGETAMKSARYYDAAEQFEAAELLDRANPLPWLARGNALLVAGDYVSAVHELQEGLRLFPQIAALRMDLNALLGGAHVCEVRQGDLQRRLAARDNFELRFLLGYLQYYSGHEAQGIESLLAASTGAPERSLIRKFPELLTDQE